MRIELRPRSLALVFGGYFVAVAGAAYLYAAGTTGPWFVGFPAFSLYAMTFLGSLLLLVGFGLFLALLARAPNVPAGKVDTSGLGARLAVLETRLVEAEEARAEVSEEEVDELLETLAKTADPEEWFSNPKDARVEREIEALKDDLAVVREALAAVGGGGDAMEAGRARLRFKRLVLSVLGPALVAVVFLGVSAMMLPGVEGFAASNYVLNNALVLGIAYNWLGLGLYAAVSMWMAVRDAR